MAAAPVCLVVAAVIFLRTGTIENTETAAVGLGGVTALGWVGTWTIITLAFGVVATAAYDHLSQKRGWNGIEYLTFALSLAVILSTLAFLEIYSGEMHPFRAEYSAFNFAYAAGFGSLIPALSTASPGKRPLVSRTQGSAQ